MGLQVAPLSWTVGGLDAETTVVLTKTAEGQLRILDVRFSPDMVAGILAQIAADTAVEAPSAPPLAALAAAEVADGNKR